MPSGERAGGKELEIMKKISTQEGRRLGSEAYRMPTTWKLRIGVDSYSCCSLDFEMFPRRKSSRESSSVEMGKKSRFLGIQLLECLFLPDLSTNPSLGHPPYQERNSGGIDPSHASAVESSKSYANPFLCPISFEAKQARKLLEYSFRSGITIE